jgi:alkanesulfonate monooxygenase SsuD/methylene tetrahydromethanopterin reductase-like flavin-dependent oxidoreductase (luciferase family)
MELEGFGIDPKQKRSMWREATEQVCNMLAMVPYPGHRGQFFSMPPRNVVPKPVQKPHPPLWLACSNRETIHIAAQLGVGALTFAFVDPAEAAHWVRDYYDTFKRECVPIGHAVNPNVAMVTGFSVHEDEQTAVDRGLEGFRFFGFALAHHYIFGNHTPGRTDIWKAFEQMGEAMPDMGRRGIGTPDQLRAHLAEFEDVGVDQVVFIQQAGRNRHDHICHSLELFAGRVMPEFHEREDARAKAKAEELAPFVESALARKARMQPLADDQIPSFQAYGRTITEGPPVEPAR